MQQVLLNLYSNAIKFTNRGGSIHIVVELTEVRAQSILRLSVIDNGIGIKQENQDNLFKLFGSIKDEKRKINMNGIGLGLVISKMIVSQFDGTIDFISKYEKGSSFYFTFKLEHFENKDRNSQY
jgi:two-component system sensor histidine kinase/response regulator